VRTKAETPAEIQTLFDGIAYGKAASVLRMVEAYVGPEVFRKAVNAYLEKHAYGNATAEVFWNQVAATSGKPVDKIMASFTEQSGAPLVFIKCGPRETRCGVPRNLANPRQSSPCRVKGCDLSFAHPVLADLRAPRLFAVGRCERGWPRLLAQQLRARCAREDERRAREHFFTGRAHPLSRRF